jgi:hypothetical protein
MKKEILIENQHDQILWQSKLRTIISSLNDYLKEVEIYIANDYVAQHAKTLLRGAESVNSNVDSTITVVQAYFDNLEKIHQTLKNRVEKRKKGIDPDKTMLSALKDIVIKPFTNNATARALYQRYLQMNNTETRK